MKVVVLGVGAYGLALSKKLLENNNEVVAWTKLEREKEEIEKQGYSNKLKDFKIPKSLSISTNLKKSIKDSKLIVFAIPAQFADSVAKELSRYYTNQHILIATKGIEQNSCVFIDEVISRYISTNKIGVISGPSFAVDIIKDIPIGLTIASTDWNTINISKKVLEGNNLILKDSKDVVGTEICGAIKNVLAIASGILEGMNLPISTQAMFLTIALNEIKKLIYELDGDPNTILSFAGFGDIILTCTSEKSRNYSFGRLIGRKESQKEINEYINNNTIEGLYTLKSIYKLVTDKNIFIPIINTINEIVLENNDPKKLLKFISSDYNRRS